MPPLSFAKSYSVIPLLSTRILPSGDAASATFAALVFAAPATARPAAVTATAAAPANAAVNLLQLFIGPPFGCRSTTRAADRCLRQPGGEARKPRARASASPRERVSLRRAQNDSRP